VSDRFIDLEISRRCNFFGALQFASASVGSSDRVTAFLSSASSNLCPTRTEYFPNFRTEWADVQREFERDEIFVDILMNVPSPNSIDLTTFHRFVDLLCVVNVRGCDGLDFQITAFLSVIHNVIEFIFPLCFSVDELSRHQ
jgi:hypothetical protein